jgi:PII-like signaling protein
MTPRDLKGDHVLLRIFLGESDKAGHKPLYVEVMERARKAGLAGCTVLRGIAGFGAASIIHTDAAFRLSSDLPIVIEIVDTTEHVDRFLGEVEPLLGGGLVTKEKAVVRRYRTGA